MYQFWSDAKAVVEMVRRFVFNVSAGCPDAELVVFEQTGTVSSV